MQQEIVPTSPKSKFRQHHQELTDGACGHHGYFFTVTILALLFGSLAGFLGFVIAANIPANWPIVGKLNVVSFLEKQRQSLLLSTRRSDESILRKAPAVIDQIVPIYSAEPRIEQEAVFTGDGVMLTTDGWLVAAPAAVSTTAYVVLSDGSAATLSKQLSDPLTGLVFVKVAAPAANAPVATLADSSIIPAGQLLSVIEKQLGSYVVYERRAAGELYRSNKVRSTTKLEQLTVLDKGTELPGYLPVFDSNGVLNGMMMNDGSVIPAAVINGALHSILHKSELSEQEIVRPQTDYKFINLARLSASEIQERRLPSSGFFILDVIAPSITSMTTVNAAANLVSDDTKNSTGSVPIQKGDVIISIENSLVSEQADLTTIINSKPVGDNFVMTVVRDQKEQIIQWQTW